MTYEAAQVLLQTHNQQHVLRFYDQLSPEQQQRLLRQIASLDFASVERMQQLLDHPTAADEVSSIEPAPVIELAAFESRVEREKLDALGGEAIQSGKVGVLLVAGGQGSRLGFDGPKGVFPVGPISNASLFEIHARKVLALERKYGAEIPLYIMTSEANDAPTKAFFETNQYFGLSSERVRFFAQGMWPALDTEGRLILSAPDQLFVSPDGHGGTISALKDSGQFEDMERRGIETLFFFQVDNPLVDVAEPGFVGLHIQDQAEVSIKVCAKRDAAEKLGIVARRGHKTAMVEYSELTPEQMAESDDQGQLRLRFGSVAIHLFSVNFLRQEAERPMPLHVAHKKVACLDVAGQRIEPESPNAYKFEKFIFDVIPDADRVVCVEFERAREFSPVKNAEGEDSPETCQRDLVAKYAGWLEAAGVTVPHGNGGAVLHPIEVDPCYALNAAELADQIGDKPLLLDQPLLLREV